MNFTVFLYQTKISPYSQGAIDEYQKRLSRYCKCQLIVIKKEKELLKHQTNSAFFYFIKPSKQTLTSEKLAAKIEDAALSGKNNLCFLIGFSKEWLLSPLNTLEAISSENSSKNLPFEELSLSSLSFSPDLTAVVLYEQIYRSYRILRKEPYHK